jgi:DNA primase
MSSTKYVIIGSFETKGYIDKPDIIGSFFGQTEGLVGEDLEFSELQRKGKLGRIDIDIKKKDGKSYGTFSIPTALNKVEVSIVAATLESITKISHTNGKIKINEIRDDREEKRKVVLKRAEEILQKLREELPESSNITKNISESVRTKSIEKYDNGEIYGGPDIEKYDEIIIVEGRADIINLLKHGYFNVLAFNGSDIPNFVKKLSKNKTIIAFLDGDKGGRDELRELKDTIYLDYYTFAPEGLEVEELSFKEIGRALKNKVKYKETNNLISKLKNIIKKDKVTSTKKIKKGLDKVNKKVDDFQKNILYSKDDTNFNNNKETKTSNIKEEENLYLKKYELDKIKSKIKILQNKEEEFLILNNKQNIIKKGKLEDFYKLGKLDNGKYLLIKGVCENSILNKSKGIGIDIILSEKKSSKLKSNKPIVRLFDEVLVKKE